MNFLAHLVLASTGPEADPLLLVGSLWPDLAREQPGRRGQRGQLNPDLPPAVRHGIAQHRLIDRITDTHPAFLRTRARLSPRFGRFAGIVADVLFDHALSQRWDTPPQHPRSVIAGLPTIPRSQFIAAVHAALQSPEARSVTPDDMAATLDAMIRHAWLTRYATVAGLEQTFAELSYRFTRRYQRPIDLTGIANHLAAHRDALLTDFDALFPALVQRVREFG